MSIIVVCELVEAKMDACSSKHVQLEYPKDANDGLTDLGLM